MVLRCLAVGYAAVPAAGMQAGPDQLAAKLAPGSVCLGQEVVEVAATSARTAAGEALAARRVVVAVDGSLPPEGIYICRDHRDTPSIQGALYSGRRCAEAVLGSLTRNGV